MFQLTRFDVASSRRNALIVALTVMLLVTVVRQMYVTPEDVERRESFSQFTGLDMDDLPPWFAAGAGGDAEVFAVMAADPFGQDEAFLIRQPVYRYTMVGFPWLAWLLSFGREELVPVAMAAITLLSVGAMAYVAVRLRDRLGTRSWLLLLNPALVVGFLGDSSEPLSILLLTLTFTTSIPWLAAALAAVRPPFLTTLADMPMKFLLGVSVAAAVRLSASWRFGGSFFDGSNNLGLPYMGFAAVPSILGFVVVAAGTVTLILGIRQRSLSWVLSGLLVIMMSSVVYDTPLNAVRGAGMLPVIWAFGTRKAISSPGPETSGKGSGGITLSGAIAQHGQDGRRSSQTK